MDHRLNQYSTFAELYDQWMSPSLYESWKEFVKQRVPAGKKILDLGCGAGHLGVRLTQVGYDYTGLDISEDMLTLAAMKQSEANLSFPLILGDMQDLSDFPTYDAIVSFCDSLCYLEEKEMIRKVFAEVYEHLEKDGVFLFDIHSVNQMNKFDGFSYHDIEDEQILLWDSFAGDTPHSCEHYLTILKETSSGLYERFEEVHFERTYPVEEVVRILEETGFSQIKVTADFNQDMDEKSSRIFFEVRK